MIVKTKYEAVEALHQQVIKDVADSQGTCIGENRCDGGGEFDQRFMALGIFGFFGVPIEMNTPRIPQNNAINRRGWFRHHHRLIGVARSLLLGAPQLPKTLWAAAVKTAAHARTTRQRMHWAGRLPSKYNGRTIHSGTSAR